ncbi:MAG TPA: branched-chain amino acid ABC transporter permease [Ramlibacter sp.]|nr:branched-chain amino acid ABC transporter permease [Ramlibacter sp.]
MKSFVRYLAAFAVLCALGFLLTPYHGDLYRKLLLWVSLALSFNFLFAIAGQLAFSHFSFYGIGAYCIVILVTQFGLPLWLAVPATLAVCVVISLAVALPATRLEGFYLALASLAFAQLFVVALNEGGALTGATGGLANYRLPDIFGTRLTGASYTPVIAAVLLLTLAILWRLDRSWFGRACRAVRDNHEAAAAMGINVRRTKVLAYACASALAGAAGMVYAFVDNTINPQVFAVDNAFLLLFMVLVGGAGRHAGAVVGAVLLYVLPFLLAPLIGHHHALVFGLVMVLVVMFQPKGLIALWDRLVRLACVRWPACRAKPDTREAASDLAEPVRRSA